MTSRAKLSLPVGLLSVGGLLLATGPLAAEVQTQKLTVQARIAGSCSVTSAMLDFGPSLNTNEQGLADTDATGTIAISCTAPATLNVGLDGGLLPVGSVRRLANGGQTISYFLFRDDARSQPWDPGETVQAQISSTGSVTVYGRVPTQTNGHGAGLYTDEVTITLSF